MLLRRCCTSLLGVCTAFFEIDDSSWLLRLVSRALDPLEGEVNRRVKIKIKIDIGHLNPILLLRLLLHVLVELKWKLLFR